ncbi:DegQ family serine endoprotease [Beggiatoa leptomitoformis]|uniref:Probable periplasmic serine endoprotease DegP-like n=1 Tax=Beggiatoa leptomitoformis TaxID=288004 RepID=A0A2N9YBX7_9GAMM|nr:DegQ family serine endoprotease [Beggiatoa leptomitoformis]ALG69279.2 Do family serine endopeptidase [Beggiatoa leptomitoformis]AUI67995.1 Do family serine endopeptidase [Beggiatoa leptomitoformis]
MRKIFVYPLLVAGLTIGLFSGILQARSLPEFTELVEKYGPAVVNISTTAKKEPNTSKEKKLPQVIPNLPEDGPFNEFFRRFFEDEENAPYLNEIPSTSLGSGFIISADGYIVTNNHVIEDSDEIIVRLTDRREFTAELIGADQRTDLALLKLNATDLPFVKLGSSNDLKVGEWVLAIGSPFGFEYSATAGIVSAKGRSLPSDSYVPFIQTDVAINPGNSGGPLFNLDGEVVGINSQIYSRTGGFMGLSFAIPVDVMKNIIDQLRESGKVSRGWLGVLIQDVTRELAESFGMQKPQGALVAKVLPNSPAATAGFQVGDIIIEFNGKKIDHSSDLPPIVGITPLDTVATTKIIRAGKEQSLQVTIAELPPEEDLQKNITGQAKSSRNKLGLTLENLDDNQRKEIDLAEGGVLVKAVEGVAEEAGVRADDIVLMMANTMIKDVAQSEEIIASLQPGQAVPILIKRGGSQLFLALKMPKEEKKEGSKKE